MKKKTWQEFRNTGLLWFINSILHLFGWVIVIDFKSYNKSKDKGVIKEVYPARTLFRGFDENNNTKGYKKVTKYLSKNIKNLLKEVQK